MEPNPFRAVDSLCLAESYCDTFSLTLATPEWKERLVAFEAKTDPNLISLSMSASYNKELAATRRNKRFPRGRLPRTAQSEKAREKKKVCPVSSFS